jgi:excisionase family DNA binding protein
MPTTQPKPTLTEQEAATYLAVTRHALRAWRLQCRGPAFHKLGRSVRYLSSELDEWLNACKVPQRRQPQR